MKLQHLFSELKRRNVYKVAVGYILTSWIILQVAAIILPAFEVPSWVMKMVLFILLLGFLVVVAFSWVYEITPEGLKKTEHVEAEVSITPQTSKKLNRLLIAVLALVIIILVFDRFRVSRGLQAASQSLANVKISPISKAIREKKVAVMVFDNKTNSEELEIFGTMIADWLTQGLMEVSEGKVVGFANIGQNMVFADADHTAITEFAKATSAEVLIQGRYYLQEQNIIVHANIVDAHTLELIYAFEPIVGPRNDTRPVLDELTQRLLGYWALSDQKRFAKKAPKYEAYQVYKTTIDNYLYKDYPRTIGGLEKAYTLDTTFYEALFKMAIIHSNRRQIIQADSIIQLIKNKYPKLSQWEMLRLQATEYHYFQGKTLEPAEIYEKMYALDPTYEIANNNAGIFYNASNYPKKAKTVLESFDKRFTSMDVLQRGRERQLATAYYFLEDYHNACKTTMSADWPVINHLLASIHLKSLVQLDSLESLDYYLDNYHKQLASNNSRIPWQYWLYYWVSMEFKKLGKTDLQLQYARAMEQAMREGKNQDLNLLAHQKFALNDFKAAMSFWEKDVAENKEPDLIFGVQFRGRWSQIGAIAAILGDTTKAQAMVDSIRQKAATFTRGHVDYLQYGSPSYAEAIIQAHLGQKDKAVALLRDALEEHIFFNDFNYKYDAFLFPLHGYPPFEELVRPKG